MAGAKRQPRSKRSKGWKWLLGLLLLVGLGSWALWGRTPPPPPPKPVPAAEAPAHMETISLTEIQEGDKRWVLEAQKADFHKDRKEISISGVQVEFFGRPEEHIFVKAQEGLLHTKTRVLTLKGEVELKSGETLIKTSIATYQPGDRVLLAPEDVTLEGPRVRVQGKGLRVELAQKKLFLAQHRLTQMKTEGWGLPH